jgi:hypothetical protein
LRGHPKTPYFPSKSLKNYSAVPPSNITAIQLNITAYNGATAATRLNFWRIMHNDIKALMRMFQDAADADPANAVAIIESGKFKVKHEAIKQKHEFEARNNPVTGTIDLIAPGAGPHACHDWRYSPDGVNFQRLPPTMQAHTHIDGLIPKTDAYFTHEVVGVDGPQGISQVIKILVK